MPKINKIAIAALTAISIFTLALTQAFAATTWGGTVASVNSTTTTLSLKTTGNTTYTVNAAGATIQQRNGTATQFAWIMPRDRVQVQGTKNDNTITATRVRDTSLVGNATFTATVRAVNGPNFLIRITRVGSVIVIAGSSTTIRKHGQPTTATNIMTGDRMRVRGLWNTANNIVLASSITI